MIGCSILGSNRQRFYFALAKKHCSGLIVSVLEFFERALSVVPLPIETGSRRADRVTSTALVTRPMDRPNLDNEFKKQVERSRQRLRKVTA